MYRRASAKKDSVSTVCLINSAESAGLENFCFEHEIGRHIDDDVIRGIVVLFNGRGHSLRFARRVGNGLKQHACEFDAIALFLGLDLSADLVTKPFIRQHCNKRFFCVWVKDEGTIKLVNNF